MSFGLDMADSGRDSTWQLSRQGHALVCRFSAHEPRCSLYTVMNPQAENARTLDATFDPTPGSLDMLSMTHEVPKRPQGRAIFCLS